mgnify:CR=1 FL=1
MRKELLAAGALSLIAHWSIFQIPLFSKGSGHLPKPQKDLEVSVNWKLAVSSPEGKSSEPIETSDLLQKANDAKEDMEPSREKTQETKTTLEQPTQKKRAKPKGDRSKKMALPSSPENVRERSEGSQEGPPQTSSGIQKEEAPTSGQGEGVPSGDSKGQSSVAQAPGQSTLGPKKEIRKAFPRYDLNPKPPYPEVARRRGQEGVVILSVLVLKDGSVGKIRVARSSGYEPLDSAALDTVARWRFVPAKVGDEPVDMEVQVPIRFKLE